MGLIIYLLGLVLGVMAVLDVLKKNISAPWKIIWIILLLATSWVGLAVYYLFAKNHIEEWCK